MTARRDPREQLRPWLRRWPIPLIRLLLLVTAPFLVVAGAVMGMETGAREIAAELRRTWKELRP